MGTNDKGRTKTGAAKIAAAMEELTQNYPDWVQMLDQFVEDSETEFPDEMEPTVKAFGKFLAAACVEIKRGNIEEEEFYKLFPQKFQSAIQKLANSRLRVFHAFAPLRTLYVENPSKVESLIDQIWQQFVIRYNPYRKFERPNGMTDEDMSNLEQALDAFAEYCGIRMLHYEGIVQRIKKDANLPNGLCAYIARKVDKDYQELRMNYVVSQLERLEKAQEGE